MWFYMGFSCLQASCGMLHNWYYLTRLWLASHLALPCPRSWSGVAVVCLLMNFPLSSGWCWSSSYVCWWRSWAFTIHTGREVCTCLIAWVFLVCLWKLGSISTGMELCVYVVVSQNVCKVRLVLFTQMGAVCMYDCFSAIVYLLKLGCYSSCR